MAVSLGVFDPRLSDREASALLLRGFPKVADALRSAEKSYAENCIFRHYILPRERA